MEVDHDVLDVTPCPTLIRQMRQKIKQFVFLRIGRIVPIVTEQHDQNRNRRTHRIYVGHVCDNRTQSSLSTL